MKKISLKIVRKTLFTKLANGGVFLNLGIMYGAVPVDNPIFPNIEKRLMLFLKSVPDRTSFMCLPLPDLYFIDEFSGP